MFLGESRCVRNVFEAYITLEWLFWHFEAVWKSIRGQPNENFPHPQKATTWSRKITWFVCLRSPTVLILFLKINKNISCDSTHYKSFGFCYALLCRKKETIPLEISSYGTFLVDFKCVLFILPIWLTTNEIPHCLEMSKKSFQHYVNLKNISNTSRFT